MANAHRLVQEVNSSKHVSYEVDSCWRQYPILTLVAPVISSGRSAKIRAIKPNHGRDVNRMLVAVEIP